MIRTKNKLTVLHDDNGAFTDFSNKMLDFDRDTQVITYDGSDDYIYVGFYKPINVFYTVVSSAGTTGNSLTLEYYNGTSWATPSGLHDDTDAFYRNGFIQWDRNQTDEAVNTINSVEQYWYRISIPSLSDDLTFSGLNLVFSDDQDLRKEYFEISSYLPEGETSHILTHVAARDEIIQYIRNSGYYKESLSTGKVKDITAFDLLDISQIKLAATYLALSKIFRNVQDENDDVYESKSREYRSLYNSAIQTFYLDIDRDDDGINDDEEKMASFTARLIRR